MLKRTCIWAALITAALFMCVMSGGLVGFLLGLVFVGMAPKEAFIPGIIGALGGLVATPFAVAFLRERIGGDTTGSRGESVPEPPSDAEEPSSVARGRSKGLISLVVKIGLLLLLPTVPPAVYEWHVWSQLQSDGLPIQAEIVSLGGTSSWRTVHQVGYRFQLPNGAILSRTQEISRDYQEGLRLGDRLPVLYLPSDPSVSRLADEDTHRKFLITIGITAVTAYVCVVGALKLSARRSPVFS
jgi:hypothetical protein